MYTLKNAVPGLIHLGHPLRRRHSPSQKDDPFGPLLGDDVDDLLCELLPALVGMAVGKARTHRQACVQHQHAAVCPGRQQAPPLRRWFETRVILFQRNIDILQRRGRLARGPNGEAESVRLAETVVWVLAKDDDLDVLKRCMLGPAESEIVPLSVNCTTLEKGTNCIHLNGRILCNLFAFLVFP